MRHKTNIFQWNSNNFMNIVHLTQIWFSLVSGLSCASDSLLFESGLAVRKKDVFHRAFVWRRQRRPEGS